MSSFNDTSNWKAVNDYTLSYPLNQKESLCEKKPAEFFIKVNKLEFSNSIYLNHVADKKNKKELYSNYSRVIGSGKLEGCNFHVISLDDSDNEMFSDVSVEILPFEETRLLKTGRKSTFATVSEERPPEGWLHDEPGRIYFHGESDFRENSAISISLRISETEFLNLAENIRKGLASYLTIEVCAEVYQFDYESMGAAIPGHRYNYAMLRKIEKDGLFGENFGDSGQTVARLESLTVGFHSGEHSTPNSKIQEIIEAENQQHSSDINSIDTAGIVEDVKRIRERIDLLYTAAITIAVVLVISQILNWL